MRAIKKSPEPRRLTELRSTPQANYGNLKLDDMAELRASLVQEQRGLCCYCLNRIRPTEGSMKVEHWHSQTGFPDEQLDYGNLLGACRGGEGQPSDFQHCDTRKGDRSLSRNPANPAHQIESFIHFLPDGSIASKDDVFDKELNDVLKLNLRFLKNNRKAELDAFVLLLGRATLSRVDWEKKLAEWNGESHNGELRPFCQVIVYWIRKKLNRPG